MTTAKYKYRLMRWDRTPGSKSEEALFDGKPMLIETDRKNHQEFALVTANKQLFSLPGRKTIFQRAKSGPGEHPLGIMSLRVVFEDGHEEGYDVVPEEFHKYNTNMAKKIIINESDHEKTIKANVGDEIEIILSNNEAVKHYWGIGGGESWSNTSASVLIFNNEKAAQITINEGRVGGFGGTSMFPFIVRSPGKAIVELLLKASGEPVEAAHDHFRVTIIAEP